MERPHITLFLATCLLGHVAQILSDPDDCMRGTGCTCAARIVRCQNMGLTAVPRFTSMPLGITQIALNGNRIRRLEASVFKDVPTDMLVAIDLQNNPLEYVDDMAFDGLQNHMIDLYLYGTRLKALPKALIILNNMRYLRVDLPLDAAVMMKIGQTLKDLDLGDIVSTQWPGALRYAQKLKTLNVRGMGSFVLPHDAFNGLNTSLEKLHIYDISMERSPDPICNLRALIELKFIGVKFSTGINVLPKCLHNITSLQRLTFHSVSMAVFPNISAVFPSLNYFELLYTNVAIPDNTLPVNLKSLYFGHNNFTRIPSIVNTLEHLEYLGITDNNLTTLTPESLPKRITSLAKGLTVYLDTNPIKCSCDWPWLLKWREFVKGRVHIEGRCHSEKIHISRYLSLYCHAEPIG